MNDAGTFEFTITHPGAHSVKVAVDGNASITEVMEAVEAFLLAAGFHPDNVREALGG